MQTRQDRAGWTAGIIIGLIGVILIAIGTHGNPEDWGSVLLLLIIVMLIGSRRTRRRSIAHGQPTRVAIQSSQPPRPPSASSMPGMYQMAKLYDGVDPQTKQPFFSPQHPRIADPAERERLIMFLRGGEAILTMMGFDQDILDPQHPKQVPVAYQTDGKWLWLSGTTYYLQTYGIAPDPDFYRYIVNCNYQCHHPTDAESDAALQWFYRQSRG